MKRVLQKQRSALKFLASGKLHGSELVPKGCLLTPTESDNMFKTLEEDYNNIFKMISTADSSKVESKLQKLWTLITTLRKNEVMLRDITEKKDETLGGPKDKKTSDADKVSADTATIIAMEMKPKESSMSVSPSEIAACKEMFEREKQHLLKEIITLKEKLTKSTEAVGHGNKIVADLEEQLKELKTELQVQTNETVKELKSRQQFEARCKEQFKQIESKEKEVDILKSQLQNTKEQVRILENTVNEQKLTNELLSQNNEHLSQRILKLQTEYSAQTHVLEELTQKCSSLTQQSKIYEENAAKLLIEANKCNKHKEMWQKKVLMLESQKKDQHTEKEKLTTQLNTLEKDIEALRKSLDTEKRNCDDLRREKELLSRNFQRINATTDEQNRILKIELKMKNQLTVELNQRNAELTRRDDMIAALEKEKEKLQLKNTELNSKVVQLSEIVSEQESEIHMTKKELNELQTNYKYQTGLLENIRTDKNLFSRSLMQTRDEIDGLKQTIKVLTRRLEEEKINTNNKEEELLKEKAVMQKLEQDKEKLYAEISSCKQVIKTNKNTINELMDKVKTLTNVTSRLETELQKKGNLIEQAVSDQELTDTHLLQKNEEITQLNVKLKLLESMHENTLSECKLHLEEIRTLNIEIKQLRTDKTVLNKNLTNMAHLRSEIFTLERELTKERIKSRALEEELQNPLNIHRWRKLEGSDPHTFELIEKIQLLQKRVLSKTEIAVAKEQQLKELGQLYENLRNRTAKLSPSEITNKLYFLRKESDEKTNKIKSLLAELSMYDSQIMEYKSDVENKNKEIDDMKREFFKQKRSLFRLKNMWRSHVCRTEIEKNDKKEIGVDSNFTESVQLLPTIKINS